MKKLMSLIFVSLLALPAFAKQTIICREINKSGSLKSKGVELSLNMRSSRSGSGLVKDRKNQPANKIEVRSINRGTAIDGSKYTTVFLRHEADVDEMLDVQLQFKDLVVGKTFSNIKATYVIGSDDANPETGFAYGYKMICSGQVN